MKRIHVWTMLGATGAGLAALLVGQSVLGQPEMQVTLPLAPAVTATPELPAAKSGGAKPAVKSSAPEAPLFPPLSPTMPVLESAPMLPLPGQPTGSRFDVPPAPTLVPSKIETTSFSARPASGPISLDVQPGKQQPAVSIEWAAPASIRLKQPMACQIVVRNTSTTPAQNVIVRHRLGQGVVCKSSEPAASNDASELVWNLGTLPPEMSRRIDLTLVSQNRGPLNCHAVVTFSAVAAHQVQVREPQLAVKMSVPDKVIAGENITLNFAISNPGDGIAEAVKLKTLLPDGLEYPRGKVVEFDVGNLAAKETKIVELICLARTGGAHQCTINVVGDGGLAASDTARVDILTPKLEVALSGPKLRYLDRHAVYVLKVSNPGSAAASNVEVQEAIPSGFKFHQANGGGKYHEATRLVSWNVGELQPGQSKEVAVDLIPIETGEHRLIAHGKAARGLKSETEIRTSVEGISSLYIDVSHVDDPIEVGAETAYEIRLANTGTKLETNVELICTLPAQLEFRGAKCSATLRFRQDGRDLIFEPLPKLAPKADVIYRVQVRGVAPGDIRFRSRVKSDSLKEPVLREESTRIYSDGAPVRPTPTPTPPSPTSSVPKTPGSTVPMPVPSVPSISASSPRPGTPMIPAPSESRPMPAPSVLSFPPSSPLPSVSSIPASSVPLPTSPSSTPIPSPSTPSGLPSSPVPPPLRAVPPPLPTPGVSGLPLNY